MDEYTPLEAKTLLTIAREALVASTTELASPLLELDAFPPALQAERACFVTLHTRDGALRGCTGTLTARQPLALEVAHMTVQTARHDPRFTPVTAQELDDIVIEISILTPSVPLQFDDPADIPELLQPHVDGVVLMIGSSRSTFLPQVWEKINAPVRFLDMLCKKMGKPAGCWRRDDVHIFTYRTIIFEESQ